MTAVIDVQHLQKRYGDTVAVDDLSFQVARGEIFGILGPNGAGKTTAVESLIGLRRPDQGSVRVLGMDPQKQRRDLAQRIGVQLQSAALADRMTVWEALELFSSFYRRTVPLRQLLDQWGLTDKRNTFFANLSGGQKQRLFIALALVNDPEVVVLDELTTGLDPQARRTTWELVRKIRDQGTTVVLVTHFMDEAETLCDRLAIIDHGRIIALDRPGALVASLAAEGRLDFECEQLLDLQSVEALAPVNRVVQNGHSITVYGRPDNLAAAVVTYLDAAGVRFQNLRTAQPNLEDLFIHLTGNQLRS